MNGFQIKEYLYLPFYIFNSVLHKTDPAYATQAYLYSISLGCYAVGMW